MSDLSDSNEIIENDDVKESCKKAALYEINYYKDKFNNDTVTLNDILFLIDNDNKINANNLKKFILHIRAKNKIKFNTINLLDLKDLLKYVIPITRSAYTVLIANESCIKNISSDSTDDLGLSSVRQQKVPRVIKINEDNINYLIKDDNIKNFCIEASLYEIRHIIHSSLLNMSLNNILYYINFKKINNAYNLKKLLLHIRYNNSHDLLDNTTLNELFKKLATTYRLISADEYYDIISNNRCIQEISQQEIPRSEIHPQKIQQPKILRTVIPRTEIQRQEIPQLSNTSENLITDDATTQICIKAALYEMKNNIIPKFAHHALQSVILNYDTTLEDLMTLPIVKNTNSYSLEKLLLHFQSTYSKQEFEEFTIRSFLILFDKPKYNMNYGDYSQNMCISMPRPEIQRPGIQRPEIQRPEIQRPGIQRQEIQRQEIQRQEIQRQEIPQLSNTSENLITDDATKQICIKAALYEMKNNILPNFAYHHLNSIILNKNTTLEDLITHSILKITKSYSLEKLLLHLQAKYIYSKQYFEGLTISNFLDAFDKPEYIMDYQEYSKNKCINMPRPVIGGKKTKYSINNDTKTNRAYIKYNNKKVYFYKNDNYKIFIEIDKKIISITKKIFGYNNSKNNYYINI